MSTISSYVRRLAGRSLAAGAGWWRTALLHRSDDATEALRYRSLMVLAPHPDDETLGCGALIARACAAGVPVSVVVATDGRHSARSAVVTPERLAQLRAEELRSAMGSLGVHGDALVALGWRDGDLAGDVPRLADQVSTLIRARRPDVVLAPCPQDGHSDHRATYQAATQAVREHGVSSSLLCYPVWAWAQAPWFLDVPGYRRRCARMSWAVRQLAAGGWLRVDCGAYLTAKRQAMAQYASQLTNLTGEAAWSHLPPEFIALFLQPYELFFPVSVHPSQANMYRLVVSRTRTG